MKDCYIPAHIHLLCLYFIFNLFTFFSCIFLYITSSSFPVLLFLYIISSFLPVFLFQDTISSSLPVFYFYKPFHIICLNYYFYKSFISLISFIFLYTFVFFGPSTPYCDARKERYYEPGVRQFAHFYVYTEKRRANEVLKYHRHDSITGATGGPV